MPYALNAWVYECASQVPSEITVRVGNKIFRILKWRVVSVKSKFETFMSTIFSEYRCSNIVSSQHEMESIVIHGSQHQPEASTSAAKVNFKKPHEVPEFEDFSTTPPTELLKRSSHVADTSSPPPSKKMNTTPAKETIQVKTTNMHKDVIPPNESEKHVSHDNVPEAKSTVGGESSSHSEQIVDRKFKRLENKIDSNHIDLLKAIDSIAHCMTSTSSQFKTDDFDQTFYIVEQQQAPTGSEEHNLANKSDPPQANDQSNVQEDIKVDNVSEQNISSDVPESFDQHVSSDTLKNNAKKDGRVAVDKTDKVEEQVEEFIKEKIQPNTSESNTSTSFSTETLDVIDTLIYGIPLPAMPLTVVSREQVVQDECLLCDS
ncbi:uncharacterized protein LOC129894406 [Solanum dulcamara]|uniref:uncharacterized protein LOC129894406 n=1 Tax=Solanum dulcamara TaxID=45834 RepID=UPI0024865D08|nr:uncharacterized protein LOC129894406 [Solanum dulcamara]